MIKLREGTITEEIKNIHKNWFWEHFKEKLKENKELYTNLNSKEKEWIKDLFGLDKVAEYDEILNAEEEIKNFIVEEDVRNVIKERDEKYKKLCRVEENKKFKEEFKSKRDELDEKIQAEKDEEKNKEYYDEFIIFVKNNKGYIENIDEIIKKIEENKKNGNEILNMNKTRLKYKESNLEEFVKLIFDYDKFQREKRHEIISSMKIEVCPYCQRQYITNYQDEKGTKPTADLDHFYIKSRYPYLAFSLYNFIPSCNVCNSRTKGTFDFYKNKGIYPHDDEFGDDAKFKTSANIINTILDNSADFEVKIDVNENAKLKDKIKNSIKAFKLNEVYATSHNDYIKDMLNTLEKYPEEYIDVIGDIFYDEKNKKEQKKELVRHMKEMIKKPYLDRIEKGEPLAKLTKDIMEEFGKIENK